MKIGSMYGVLCRGFTIWKNQVPTDHHGKIGGLMTGDMFQLIKIDDKLIIGCGYIQLLILRGETLGWIDVWVGANRENPLSQYFREITE